MAADRDLDGFLTALGDIPHPCDAAALRVKSVDFSWFSPIMSAALEAAQLPASGWTY